MMMQRLAFSVDEFAALAGIGRTVAYRETREGRLRPLKVGRRTIISHEDAMRWLAALAAAPRVRRTVAHGEKQHAPEVQHSTKPAGAR